jgi:hypothetical protein
MAHPQKGHIVGTLPDRKESRTTGFKVQLEAKPPQIQVYVFGMCSTIIAGMVAESGSSAQGTRDGASGSWKCPCV